MGFHGSSYASGVELWIKLWIAYNFFGFPWLMLYASGHEWHWAIQLAIAITGAPMILIGIVPGSFL